MAHDADPSRDSSVPRQPSANPMIEPTPLIGTDEANIAVQRLM
ncbi:MAG TPA: hypothetical protein VIC82_05845 [Candidatus Nanopelagicales bacterium]